jgi:radical SAM superfamily enzyme YgiQ (UPF0313 family)
MARETSVSAMFGFNLNSDAPIIKDKPPRGVPIVLTSSRSEMSHYHYDPFVAFVCTFPHKLIPSMYKEKWLAPIEGDKGGGNGYKKYSNKFAPYGLRKVESILIDEFGEDNVIVTHFDNLHKVVGPQTQLVGISTMDPMGLAYVSTTYNSLIAMGGEPLNSYEFRKIIDHPSINRFRPKIIVGGAGVWQIRDAKAQDEYGIDVLMQGETECELVGVVKKLLDGKTVPKYIVSKGPDYEHLSMIKRAATYGTVEVTRGCGRGCQFCSPTKRKKCSFPIDHIMKEVAITVETGSRMIFPNSEDIFLYDSYPNFIPNRPKIVELFTNIAGYPGVELIHLSHASLAPIIHDPKILEELAPILLEKTDRRINGKKFVTVEVGVETGSVRLMKKYMKGKALPFKVDNWPELVVQGISNMNDHDWYPLCTIMAGMPGETESDIIATLELIDELQDLKLFYTPVLFIPLAEAMLSDARRIDLDNLNELQWEFITACWKKNVKIWLDNKAQWLIKTLILSSLPFYRLKHGSKALRPILKVVGFPDDLAGGPFAFGKQDRACEPELCFQENGLRVNK